MSQKKLLVDDKELPFTKAEYEICEFLAKNRGQVFSKEQILEAVFGFDNESNDSTIITHIKNIRAKFELTVDDGGVVVVCVCVCVCVVCESKGMVHHNYNH